MRALLVPLIVITCVAGYTTPARSGGLEPRAQVPDTIAPASAKPDTLAAAPECVWLGRRAVLVLLRDDLIATEGFLRVYRRFECPMDHLKATFGCAVAAADNDSRDVLERWVRICWQNPGASYPQFLDSLPPKGQEKPEGAG